MKREEDETYILCGEEEESSEPLCVRCPVLALLRLLHKMGASLGELVESPVRAMTLHRIVILSRLK